MSLLCGSSIRHWPMGQMQPELFRPILPSVRAIFGLLLSTKIRCDPTHCAHRRYKTQSQSHRENLHTNSPSSRIQPTPSRIVLPGGEFCCGDLDFEDDFCRLLAEHLPCIVISVGYRLAPEHKAPAQLDDALEAWNWVSYTTYLTISL